MPESVFEALRAHVQAEAEFSRNVCALLDGAALDTETVTILRAGLVDAVRHLTPVQLAYLHGVATALAEAPE